MIWIYTLNHPMPTPPVKFVFQSKSKSLPWKPPTPPHFICHTRQPKHSTPLSPTTFKVICRYSSSSSSTLHPYTLPTYPTLSTSPLTFPILLVPALLHLLVIFPQILPLLLQQPPLFSLNNVPIPYRHIRCNSLNCSTPLTFPILPIPTLLHLLPTFPLLLPCFPITPFNLRHLTPSPLPGFVSYFSNSHFYFSLNIFPIPSDRCTIIHSIALPSSFYQSLL